MPSRNSRKKDMYSRRRNSSRHVPDGSATAHIYRPKIATVLAEGYNPAVLILALGGLKVRHIDSEHGYFRAELTVIPSVCGDSGKIDSEVARHLRLSFGQAE